MSKYLKAATAAVIGISVAAIPALAAEVGPTTRLTNAWSSALRGAEPVLTPAQFAKLNNLAYQAAAVRICDGFEISEAKFSSALAEATKPAKSDLSEDDIALHQNFVLVEFGMRYGLLLAEGNVEKTAFCAGAAELKSATDVPNIWE